MPKEDVAVAFKYTFLFVVYFPKLVNVTTGYMLFSLVSLQILNPLLFLEQSDIYFLITTNSYLNYLPKLSDLPIF